MHVRSDRDITLKQSVVTAAQVVGGASCPEHGPTVLDESLFQCKLGPEYLCCSGPK